jgi:hypothetical protein
MEEFFETAIQRSNDRALLKQHMFAACKQFCREQEEPVPKDSEIADTFMDSDMYYDPGTKRLDDDTIQIYYHIDFTSEGARLWEDSGEEAQFSPGASELEVEYVDDSMLMT